MNKKVIGLALGAALALVPLATFAATTQTFLTLDGDSTATLSIGDSVDGVLTFNNTGNSTVQSVKVEVPGSHIPGACLNIEPNQNASGTHTASFPVVTSGATEGTWDVKITTYGVQSNLSGANNNCDGTVGVNNSHTFNNVLTLTASQSTGDNSNNTGGSSTGSSTSGSSNGGVFGFATFADFIAAIKAALGIGSTPAPTGPDAICSQLPPGSNVTALQSFLMANGQSASFNAAGVYAPTGYLGPITLQALSNFKYAHHCN